MKQLLEVKQAAELLGITERTAQWRIKSGKLAAEETPSRGGRGGIKYMVPLSELPPTKQAEYLRGIGQAVDNAPVTPGAGKDALPAWAERTALARADLVHAWQNAKAEAQEKGKKIGDAVKGFLKAYNTGLMLPKVHEALGGKTISSGTLYRWASTYEEAGRDYRALAPEWGSNRGESKVTEDERNLLLSQLLHQNRIKVNTAIKITKYILERRGIDSPSSPNTLRRFAEGVMKENYDAWVALREGEKALNDKVLPYLKRDSSLLSVGDVLVADGHRLNFQVINPHTGKPCRATLLGFFDWASRDMVGFDIMVEENTQVVAGALRNAILEMGKVPKAVLLDNGKAFKARVFTSDVNLEECGYYGMFARLGILTHFAWPYNAQSKPIERFFGTFGNSFERLLPSYTGGSIDDKPGYMRRNEKFLQSLHNGFVPTVQQAMGLIGQWREFYRTQPHRGLRNGTPGEVLDAGRGPGVEPRELDFLMMSMETASIGRNGVRFLGQDYFHEALYGLRDKVVIRYSFFDLTHVLVYTTRGEYLCAAKLVEAVHPMASMTGRGHDLDAVKQGIRRKRELKRQTLKVVKLAAAAGGKDPALPWHEIVPSVPRIAEAIEAQEATGRNVRALPDTVSVEDGEAALAELEAPARRLYMDDFEKYDDLKGKQDLTEDERRWMREFEKTDSYRYVYA